MSKKLSLKLIESYKFSNRTFKPDWDDTAIEITLPNGANLIGFTQINNQACKTNSLEGFDGFIYIETKEELEELINMNFDQICEKIALEMLDDKFSYSEIENVTGLTKSEILKLI